MQSTDRSAGVLGPLGVSDVEEQVYRTLVRRGLGSLDDVMEATALPQRSARQALVSLESKALLTRSTSQPKMYIAVPPKAAANILALRRQEELEQARLAAASLAEEAGIEAPAEHAGELVERVAPGHTTVSVNYQVLMSAEREILGFIVPPIESPEERFINMKLDILRRGVKARVIYTPESLEKPGILDFIEAVRFAGEEPRVAPRLFTYMVIVDRRIAYMRGRWDSKATLGHHLVVHPSSLLDGLVELFEHAWERAAPFEPSGRIADPAGAVDQPPLSAEEKRVLALLGAGMQNHSIATQLGIGQRSVQRHVGRIMEVLGTRTRFQTGMEAYRRGWVGAPPASVNGAG